MDFQETFLTLDGQLVASIGTSIGRTLSHQKRGCFLMVQILIIMLHPEKHGLEVNEEEFLYQENGHVLPRFDFSFLLLLSVCRECVEIDVPFRCPHHPTGVDLEHEKDCLRDNRDIAVEILAEMVTFDGPIVQCSHAEIRDHVPHGLSEKSILEALAFVEPFDFTAVAFFAEYHANLHGAERDSRCEEIALIVELPATHHDFTHELHDRVEFHEILTAIECCDIVGALICLETVVVEFVLRSGRAVKAGKEEPSRHAPGSQGKIPLRSSGTGSYGA